MKRQEIIKFIKTEFDVEPERLWTQFPDYLVFRNKNNKKWFAIIMDIEKCKLGINGEGKADVIDLKCDKLLIGSLLLNKGYLPAYHMNKSCWISVLPDEVKDGEIKDLIRLSYEIVDKK